MESLTTALAATLPIKTIQLESKVTSIRQIEDGVSIELETGGSHTFSHVILAIPPRFVSHISFQPELSETTKAKLANTPTWMAGQAKVLAVYDRPFWRDNGLSGQGMSWAGLLQEIHDASQPDGLAALFGFFRLSAAERSVLDWDELNRLVIDQLVRLYGEEARHPRDIYYVDWSSDRQTATVQDREPLTEFPVYQPITLDSVWEGRLSLAGTETDPLFGGHLEGALRSAERVVEQLQPKNAYLPESGTMRIFHLNFLIISASERLIIVMSSSSSTENISSASRSSMASICCEYSIPIGPRRIKLSRKLSGFFSFGRSRVARAL
ncbi:flavin monoamine oxidase family protein [Exiguobacterium mexicanum]|uniref:flavin monoamine oxidase family protein n=1 Tax=Exiguobacterium mexicanum TaxID=340146 RepID=UPI0037BF06B6